MSLPKRQHIIPKFYLEKWCVNDLLYVYDVKKRQFRQQTSINTAVQKKYYTWIDKNGNPVIDLEKLLAFVESHTSPVIDKIINKIEISAEELGTLAFFISYLFVRVPKFRNILKDDLKEFSRYFIDHHFGTVDRAKKTLNEKSFRNKTRPNLDPKKIVELFSKHEFIIKKDLLLVSSTELGSQLAQVFGSLDWCFHYASSEGSFITSDNPVSILSPQGIDSNRRPIGGLLEKGVYKFVPLGPKVCLRIGYSQDSTICSDTIPRWLIRIVNSCIALNCDRFLFSHNKALLESIIKRIKLN